MKFNKFDIGAEILSILTKGMYPDPRDAVREYIQNAVDAEAKSVEVTVGQNSVVVEDTGNGMNYQNLRDALRLGISEKRPGKDVGFMGIGIYSAFHLCNKLIIFTRKAGLLPQRLEMNFEGMREILQEQKEARLEDKIEANRLIDLQTLLESFIDLTDEDSLDAAEYPAEKGTRVELVGLDPILDDLLNNFDEFSKYLQDVIPLHFNKDKFVWAELIEKRIMQSCDKNNAHFEVIDLKLKVGSESDFLYRPYLNSSFANNKPQEPKFVEIKKDGKNLLGIVWGCLNSTRDRIEEERLRGFLLKKQGFSIGRREDLSRFFGRSNTHFDRYVGEVIIVSPEILPNAARNEIEFSSLKTIFERQLIEKAARFFNKQSADFQENDKAQEIIKDYGNKLKLNNSKFNENEDNPNTLLSFISDLSEMKAKIKRREKKVSQENKQRLENLYQTADDLENRVTDRLNKLINNKVKKTSGSTKGLATRIDIAKKLSEFTATEVTNKFENIMQLVNFLEIDYSDEMEVLLNIIDERSLQAKLTTRAAYYKLLDEIKNDFFNEEIL